MAANGKEHTSASVDDSSEGRFPRNQQFDDSLVIYNKQICRRPKVGKRHSPGIPPVLPGYPLRSLENTPKNNKELGRFLKQELITPKLNQMAPHLWLVGTPNHSYISPFHEQLVRGRNLIITEDPDLHLTWIDNRVFIKPLPPYITSHAFWQRYLESSLLSPLGQEVVEELQPAILGYLRSWTYLVRHESDFVLAKDAHLIPRGVQYPKFMRFLSNFRSSIITDDQVSPRYRFGQLRLSRLNVWAKVFLGRREFEQVYWQYWQYFQTFYAPLLFIFAVFTVVLSAMQVGMTAPNIWPAFAKVSIWFSVVTLLIVAITAVSLFALFLIMGMKEVIFATRAIYRKRNSQDRISDPLDEPAS